MECGSWWNELRERFGYSLRFYLTFFTLYGILLSMIKICEYCTKEYKIKPSKAERSHYCSKDCHNKGQKGKHRTPMHTCPQCDIEFRATNKIQICCSRECNAKLRDFEIYKEKECQYCSILFYSDKKNQKCCSRTCTMKLRMADPIEKEKVFSSRRGESSWNKDMKMDDEWCEANKRRVIAHYNSPEGEATKQKLSILATEQNIKNGAYGGRNYLRGTYSSIKGGKIKYDSSYELQAYKLLDQLSTVKSYSRCNFCIEYEIDKKTRRYIPDILVTYNDSTQQVIEIKPERLVEDEVNQAKFASAETYCAANDLDFVVWTENKLFD